MNAYAAVCEIVESTDEANWKKWAENRGHVNRSAMIGEIVDGAHFLANTLCALGVTDEEWETRYQEKQQQNAVRQSASYDKNQDKCPRCRRELDKHGMLHLDVQDGIRCAGCSYRIGELMPSGEPNWDKHSGVIIKNAKFR
jgi:DNA-directed RNA polymerase subunit RPC12/RpoP